LWDVFFGAEMNIQFPAILMFTMMSPDVDHVSSHLGAVGSCMLAPRIKFARGPMSYMKDLKELRGAQPNFMGAVSCKF